MPTPDPDREAAWSAVHDALPARWQVGPALYSPQTGGWSVSARGPHPGRGRAPQTVTGTGADELAALRDLDAPLRGVPQPDGSRMEELNRRLRAAFLAGAEEHALQAHARGLTVDELGRVLRHYPGDVDPDREP